MKHEIDLSEVIMVDDSIGDCSLLVHDDDLPNDFPADEGQLGILRACINDCKLTSRELKAIQMRLGLAGHPAMTRIEVAQALEMSIARVSHIEAKMLRHSPLRKKNSD